MSKNDTNIMAVSPKGAHKAILAATRTKRAVFVWGPPGIGKSDIVRQVADGLNVKDNEGNVVKECKVYDVRLLLMDPTDLRGVPYRNPEDNRMYWSEPSVLPPQLIPNPLWNEDAVASVKQEIENNENCILFLDELTAAPPSVQAAAYQLVLDRRIGDYMLPENCRVVAAGNRQSDRGVVYKMPTPLSNRFIHIEMKVDTKEWLEWAITHGAHPEVIGFIEEKKSALHQFDAASADSQRAFATPRSWHFVSDLTHDAAQHNVNEDTYETLVMGSIGQGLGTEFTNWRRSAKDLPKASDILAGKVTELKNKNISAQYYIVAAVCYETNEEFKKVKEVGDPKAKEKFNDKVRNMTNFVLNNLNQELRIMAFRTMVSTYKIQFDIKDNEGMRKFLVENKKLIIDAVGQM